MINRYIDPDVVWYPTSLVGKPGNWRAVRYAGGRPLEKADPTGKYTGDFSFRESMEIEQQAYQQIDLGFRALEAAGTKLFDMIWGPVYKTIGEFREITSLKGLINIFLEGKQGKEFINNSKHPRETSDCHG